MLRSPRGRSPCLVAVLLLVLAGAVPAGAQAAPVTVSVRIDPEVPEPGADVTVGIRVRNCPPGSVRVEVFLTSNDGVVESAALVERQEIASTLFFRARTAILLSDASAGWYGVRALCGGFRPPRRPLANTRFAVGPTSSVPFTVDGSEVPSGATLGVRGTGCAGGTVELDASQPSLSAGPFGADVEVAPAFDGSWAGDVPFAMPPGPGQVRARCRFPTRFGDAAYRYFGGPAEVRVLSAQPR